MAAVGLKLYSYWRSSACYRVRIALNLKGLPYEQLNVHLANSEQRGDEFGEDTAFGRPVDSKIILSFVLVKS